MALLSLLLTVLMGVVSPVSPAAFFVAQRSVGGFGWPITPVRVTRPFVPPPEPWLAGHRGVDLAGETSAEIHASGPGTVTYSGRVAGIGVVSIAHPGGLRTTYEPLTPA